VNIGNPAEITIKQFAQEIVKLTGTKQKLVHKPLPQDDPMQRRPDITLAKKLLKWTPKVSRAEGLKITYAYFKSLSSAELREKEHNTFEGYVRK
jgi:dTDP-glucose 4,6-dehydratase